MTEVVEMQPVLWARAMLDEAEKVSFSEARDAILTRVGLVLFCRFGILGDLGAMQSVPPRAGEAVTSWSVDYG